MPLSANFFGQNFSPFNVAGGVTNQQLIPAQFSEAGVPLMIRVLDGFILSNGTQVTFNQGSPGSGSGSSGSSGSGSLSVNTGTPISPNMPFQNGGGIVFPFNGPGWFQTGPGQALTVTTGAGPTVAIQLNWVSVPYGS
jgi:hypothetical protein